ASINLSLMFSWMNKREFAVHLSPLNEKIPQTTASNARSKSASSKTKIGDFPPNSIEVAFNVSALFLIIVEPVVVSPVNDINCTSGCFTSASPAVSPNPCTTLNTPFGKPALSITCANKLSDNGENSAGFNTTVFPVANSGETFHVTNMNVIYHCVINYVILTVKFNI